MKKHIGIIILLSLVLLVLLISTVSFTVDQMTDIAIVTRFGKVDRVITGDDPGLHGKWLYPIERVIILDSRNHVVKTPYKQFVTGEKFNVLASGFCTWRIRPEEGQAERFYNWQKTTDAASDRILSMLNSELSSALGKRNMSELVNTVPEAVKLEEISQNLKTQVQMLLDQDNAGVEVTDVGIDAMGVPTNVSQAIIEQVKADRQKEALRLRAEGESRAAAIVGIAESARDKILAFTDRKARDIETLGDAKAAEYYTQFREDPSFAIMLRELETLRMTLGNNTDFVLDSSKLPVLQWLQSPPTMKTFQPAPAGGR